MKDDSLAEQAQAGTSSPEQNRTDAPPALAVEGLRRSYGDFEAVRGISFEIHSGEVFGLLGPNGAGKTTTISVLSTALKPTDGDAKILGHSVRTGRDEIRRTLGLVPQEISIYPALSAAENVRFFGQMHGVATDTLEQRVDTLLDLVGLSPRRDDRAETFSGGMKRRLNLAISLVHDPKVLLLDEPTVGVDPHSREHIFDIVRNLRNRGTAILYTTHYMEEAEDLCDRLGVMDEGNIVAMGALGEMLKTLGCRETIRVTGAPSHEIMARFGNHPAVQEIKTEGSSSQLFVTNAKELLGGLQQALDRHPDATLQISPMSLGDLFLHLTGKELRD